MQTKYLELKHILDVCAQNINKTSYNLETIDKLRVLDKYGLESALAQPRQNVYGQELYPTIFDKAACYFYLFAAGHIFYNGNKRMGVATSIIFLYVNEFLVTATDEQLVEVAKSLANSNQKLRTNQREDIQRVAQFFKKNSRYIGKPLLNFDSLLSFFSGISNMRAWLKINSGTKKNLL